MSSLRAFALCVVTAAVSACAPNLCDRSAEAAKKTQGDCGELAGPLLGSSCSSGLTSCSEADQQLLSDAVACISELTVCSALTKDAWKLQQERCAAGFDALSQSCRDAFFMGVIPGFDAGIPDAGPQPIVDGGNGVDLVVVANEDTVALAWELNRVAPITHWVLVETDGVGDNRRETDYRPGALLNLTLSDAGTTVRQYFIAGLNDQGEVLTGTPQQVQTDDAGTNTCSGINDCPPTTVCDLGQCRIQTCVFGGTNTCPTSYACADPGVCRRVSDDGGAYVPPNTLRDAGSDSLLMASQVVQVTPRPPSAGPSVAIGQVPARAGDVAAFDSARVITGLEQEGQLISHTSSARGLDFVNEQGTSFGLDTTGSRLHLAWNTQSDSVYACYIVGRGVRVRRSGTRGRSWGPEIFTLEPPVADDGGVSQAIRDCDIAPYRAGGATLVTAEDEALVVRDLDQALKVVATTTAFTSTLDAGAAAVRFPSRPAIATYVDGGTSATYVTFTASRLLTGGVADTEPYAVVRTGDGAFGSLDTLTAFNSPSALPDDFTDVAVHPETGQAIAVFSTLALPANNSTVYVSVFSPTARQFATASHLNALVTDTGGTLTYLFPTKRREETYNVYSPKLATLPKGRFALSVVAGPKDANGIGTYYPYLVPFDVERVPEVATGKGWFVPPAIKMSDRRALDPKSASSGPLAPVSGLAADSQISVFGMFIEGGGIGADVAGPAHSFHWP